jgi:hypothetical protein
MRRGTLPPNQHPPGHAVPHRAPACPPMVPAVPRQLSLVVPSSPPIGGNGGTGPRLTPHFTANTCPKCQAITIAGAPHGIRIDLEPTTLDDHTEYAALLADIPTYDLWPDNVARRRHLEEIAHPQRVPRHARHTCGTTYGTQPRPTPPASSQPDPTGPPPF